jgi:hypothetical protein
MAFLEILSENRFLKMPCVLWVRPGRGIQKACRVSYSDIVDQVRRALNRWDAR